MPFRSVGFDDDSSSLEPDKTMIPFIKEQIKLAKIVERMLSAMSSGSWTNTQFRHQNITSFDNEFLNWKRNLNDWADFRKSDMIDKTLKPSIAGLQYVGSGQQGQMSANGVKFALQQCSDIVVF